LKLNSDEQEDSINPERKKLNGNYVAQQMTYRPPTSNDDDVANSSQSAAVSVVVVVVVNKTAE